MNEVKTFVETQFDKLFTQKPVLKYEFDVKKMGTKDRKIIQCLLEYGVEGKKCLDVGPGTGRWLRFLKNNDADYLGAIDISQVSLNRCSLLCDKTQRANLETDRFDFESNYFDIIISFEVLEHLTDPSNYLSEIFRVTKEGGIVLMSTPNIVSFISRIRVLLGRLPAAVACDKTHVSFYRKRDIIKLVAAFNAKPEIIPTSISLNPFEPKSRFHIPAINLTTSLNDSFLFMIRV